LGESFKVDDEGVADLGMNKVFIIDVVDLLSLDDLALVEQFEGDVLACLFVFGDLDLAEATLAEDSSDLVVFQLELFDGLSFTFLHGIFKIDY
jgi:hypothetical protein